MITPGCPQTPPSRAIHQLQRRRWKLGLGKECFGSIREEQGQPGGWKPSASLRYAHMPARPIRRRRHRGRRRRHSPSTNATSLLTSFICSHQTGGHPYFVGTRSRRHQGRCQKRSFLSYMSSRSGSCIPWSMRHRRLCPTRAGWAFAWFQDCGSPLAHAFFLMAMRFLPLPFPRQKVRVILTRAASSTRAPPLAFQPGLER